ncbi:hypothetical protein CDL15_Pgr025313 [Punica granatum]|uniref:Uncharacterized protein n=1 Tax=Punica granatum TaxID=22663 RepID=A0A218W8Z7_PUNGR|nr:hypothetical protein CDL15_Pgr025313 [Punica granatum]PKI57786.1 hypothetical protein CRG98_021853 [Punica granatum]
MASDEDISLDSYFLSAPNSPQWLHMDSPVTFYSVPPSPSHRLNPRSASGSSPNSDRDHEFEFNTVLDDGFITESNFGSPVHWPISYNQGHRGCESLSAMAFADELFCDGKVMPLKPPPGSLRSADGSPSPCFGASPPRSPRSPFFRRSLWNDDFDPFMAALENVKEEEGGNKQHRRARSLSPFRTGGDSMGRSEPGSPELPVDQAPSPYSVWEPNKKREGPVGPKPQAHGKLAGPRGLRIMRFLMKSKSMSTEEEANGLKKKTNLLRRLSFNRNNNNNKLSTTATSSRAVAKVTALQYKPRLFLCVGYGMRSFRYVK